MTETADVPTLLQWARRVSRDRPADQYVLRLAGDDARLPADPESQIGAGRCRSLEPSAASIVNAHPWFGATAAIVIE